MKKFFTYFTLILILFSSIQLQSLSYEDTDETVETAETPIQNEKPEELMFEPIDLDMNLVKQEKVKRIKVRVEQNEKPKFVKNYRKTWDDNKFYRYQYYSDSKNQQPLIAPASYGAYLETQLDENTTIQTGQWNLSFYNGAAINFIGKNESDFDIGTTLSGHARNFDYSVGVYTATNTLNNSYGGIVSTKPKKLGKSKGEVSVGTGMYSTDFGDYSKNTAGFFTKYRKGKFTITGQLAQNTYTNGGSSPQSMHIVHQYQLNDHFLVKGKLIREFGTEYSQDELTLRYSPSFKKDVVFFDLTTSYVNNIQSQPTQRFKFMTNINF